MTNQRVSMPLEDSWVIGSGDVACEATLLSSPFPVSNVVSKSSNPTVVFKYFTMSSNASTRWFLWNISNYHPISFNSDGMWTKPLWMWQEPPTVFGGWLWKQHLVSTKYFRFKVELTVVMVVVMHCDRSRTELMAFLCSIPTRILWAAQNSTRDRSTTVDSDSRLIAR